MADKEFRVRDEQSFPWTVGSMAHKVFFDGTGPGVLILHEVNGLSPACIRLAGLVKAEGFKVYLPLFFGKPGDRSFLRGNLQTLRLCVAREIRCLATDESSPITVWLRALCRRMHEECGNNGVGVIGMCVTGGFVLSTMIETAVRAPVICQPALPFHQIPLPFGASKAQRKAALGISLEDLSAAVERSKSVPLLGYRFKTDEICPAERFQTLRERFGGGFRGTEIPTGPNEPGNLPNDAHSVLTSRFKDEPGHPTRKALDEILTYFREQLPAS